MATKINDYRKLSHLLPGADCDTLDGLITVWRDARPQPTYDEIDAVNIADVLTAIEAEEEAEMAYPHALRSLAIATFNQENRIRVLEGAPAITRAQFLKALRLLN